MNKNFFKKYLLPGFIFQSVIIGGGYGTGREIVEYFLSYGPLTGLLGMLLVTTVVWSVFLALTFEFTRVFKAYNYKDFFRQLLGRYWFVFEIVFLVYVLLVLAVLSSASGSMLLNDFGMPYYLGVAIMLTIVAVFTFKGSAKIEKFLAIWSFLLCAVYLIFLIITLSMFGDNITENFSASSVSGGGWIVSAFKYGFYNMANVIGVIFCIYHIETRKEAVSAGLIGGFIGIIPGLLLFVALTAYYVPGSENCVTAQDIPSAFAFGQTGITALAVVFQVILFGTLIETGTALMHAFNERVFRPGALTARKPPRYLRPLIAGGFIIIAVALSSFGIIDLIAKGYGIISWFFLAVFLLPLATVGVYKIGKNRKDDTRKNFHQR